MTPEELGSDSPSGHCLRVTVHTQAPGPQTLSSAGVCPAPVAVGSQGFTPVPSPAQETFPATL